MDFSASLMSKFQVQVEGRTEPPAMAGVRGQGGAVLKETAPAVGHREQGEPRLDPGSAAFLLGNCGRLS